MIISDFSKVRLFGNSNICFFNNGQYNKYIINQIFYSDGYKPSYSSPPKDFEKTFNLNGVSENWNMPYGLTHKKMEYIIRSLHILSFSKYESLEIYDDLYAIYLELIKLNPKIGEIHTNYQKVQVMIGMTSCFNFDDISYFIEYLFPEEEEEGVETKKYKMKQRRVYKLLKETYRFNWRVSEKTLDKIINQLV